MAIYRVAPVCCYSPIWRRATFYPEEGHFSLPIGQAGLPANGAHPDEELQGKPGVRGRTPLAAGYPEQGRQKVWHLGGIEWG